MKLFFRLFLLWAFLPLSVISQSGMPSEFCPEPRGLHGIRVMFYNVENLFDTENDPDKEDDDFTPEGSRRWTEYRFWDKVNKLSGVITSVGGWEPPAIVGLCEVENRNALNALFYGTGLKEYEYRIIHFVSPDVRGIDVALAYRPAKLTLLRKKAFLVDLGETSSRPTRDILYTKMETLSGDTLHILVNHWPSRWGGQEASRPRRVRAASILKSISDSLKTLGKNQNILIMGDFNDEPHNQSLYDTLNARDTAEGTYLINLMMPWVAKEKGTYFFREATGARWNMLDQFIVSQPLLNQKKGIHVRDNKAHIFDAEFLICDEDGERKPFRSFIGFRYIGGYSDHLPIYMDLFSAQTNGGPP